MNYRAIPEDPCQNTFVSFASAKLSYKSYLLDRDQILDKYNVVPANNDGDGSVGD